MKSTITVLCLVLASTLIHAQGLITSTTSSPSCGSYDLMEHIDLHQNGFLESSNQMMMSIQNIVSQQMDNKTEDEIYSIPVVFHVVYNDENENIPDSVLQNQLDLLNDSYRRRNADTVNLRPEFLGMSKDSKIEFRFASTDPNGNPTNGITRTASPIEYFGGVLPYNQSQPQEIQQWVQDSLYYNLFRLTEDSLGGISPWDEEYYLNIWIGDLRIFEPQFNNFEEFVFFALATPPFNHPSWPTELETMLAPFSQGVLIDYRAVGPNNPSAFPIPYQNFNNLLQQGKTLVHEVGHYIGLRHIWGDDASCAVDDFITDTPNANNNSQWQCNPNQNTCTDNINGVDLPDMIENYMDYSSNACQNSFTIEQVDAMRFVLENYRTELATTLFTGIDKQVKNKESIVVYPNPARDYCTIQSKNNKVKSFEVYNILGTLMFSNTFTQEEQINMENYPKGVYLIKINSEVENTVFKVVKE